MKALVAFLFLASAVHGAPVAEKSLNPGVVTEVPTARQSGNTTILFPGRISGLYAKSIAAQEQPNANFLLSFTPGNFYFTVRALKPDVEDHLTVIFNRKAYVLHLIASDEPTFSLTLVDDRSPRAGRRAVVPERLLSLMDVAKAYPLFAKDRPDAIADVLHAEPDTVVPYENFQVIIRDVWRFEQDDTVVFGIELQSPSDEMIIYQPQDLAVRLGDRIYPQSIADASGIMPPDSVTVAYFAITGDGEGGRNNLAPDNDWNVLIVRSEPGQAVLSEAGK